MPIAAATGFPYPFVASSAAGLLARLFGADGHAVRGGVQSDAVCLQFASAVDAVLVGRKLFADTFRRSNRSNLLWVRGVIVQGEPEMPIETTRQLQESTPDPTGRYRDVLWPVPEDLKDWPSLCRRMLDRLRWASDGGDLAFLHASATHLLFEEISSILHSLTKSGESG